METSPRIRPARPDELPVIQEFSRNLFSSDGRYDPHLVMSWPDDPSAGAGYFKRRLGGDGVVLMAEVDSGVVGYLAGAVQPNESYRRGTRSELENMFVRPEARRLGVGSALIDAFVSWSREQRADEVYVRAYFDNIEAVAFYKNCGFRSYSHDLLLDLRDPSKQLETEVEELRAKGIYALEQRPLIESPVVVLIHGITVDLHEEELFDTLVPKLAERGIGSVRFDLRDHGRSAKIDGHVSIDSSVDDLREVIRYVRRTGALGGILGSSFGGCNAAVLASELGEAVNAVVLYNPCIDPYAVFFDPGTDWSRKYLGPASLSDLERGDTRLLNDHQPIGIAMLESTRRWDIPSLTRSITAPTLFIHGTRDTYVPWETTRETAMSMPNASFLTLDASHGFGELDAREVVTSVTAAFFEYQAS